VRVKTMEFVQAFSTLTFLLGLDFFEKYQTDKTDECNSLFCCTGLRPPISQR